MSSIAYNDLITKTFRDDAIRSVMMIDDDFVPYDELCQQDFCFSHLSLSKQKGTEKAASIHRFFQTKKIMCDVDKGDDHVNVEKIRKSDLVILDYHLEPDDPTKSMHLLANLSVTEHMNLVVIYTREDLEKVWLTAAACLAGSVETETFFPGPNGFMEFWDAKTDSSSEIPLEWSERITLADLECYLSSGQVTAPTSAWFGSELKQHGKSVLKIMCERRLSELNIIGATKSISKFSGENGQEKWIQLGNVFVVLHRKTVTDNPNEPAEIWSAIQDALIAWRPSYYQMIISEMQNRLENEAISFAKNLTHDIEGQAAWLHEILGKVDSSTRQSTVNQLFERLTDELRIKLYENPTLRDMQMATFDALKNTATHAGTPLLSFSAAHLKLPETRTLKLELGHALNYALCTRDFDGTHVTSGTVLCDSEDTTKWYLCVAPACETVPLQTTGLLAKRLSPHRMMKVLVLENSNLAEALACATESNHIFVKDTKSSRKALSVLNPVTKQPIVDYALVMNHDSSSKEICDSGIVVSFLELNEESEFTTKERKLIPISQLRDIYTARYQAIASHHTGRIGVDFVKFL